ncbi:hypothetical protein PCL_10529 [Purpureocillium lilacinum]|uniref:Uncharacterized protein n=1 Tax=Purpureocillium lilacinum TaxID=33203 RepID=A0A2U3DQ29_PURLI|nr:hypothetical protein PCL_10529 [Purpureocillium lilacinum]
MRPKLPLRNSRSRAKDGPAFVFVEIAAGADKNDSRAVVRRQAARCGRTRREDESASQKNIASLPDSCELMITGKGAPSVTSSSKNRTGMWKNNTVRNVSSPGLMLQPLSSGYEAFRLRYNFDITDLTSFTDVDLATSAYQLLRDEPNHFGSLLRRRYPSFLACLPSRYGSVTCLDDAMHCVAARASQICGVPVQTLTPSFLYGKALHSLQMAIKNGSDCTNSDIYCVTRLMVLYQSIGPPDTTHLVYHHRAGIKLVGLREPECYASRFECLLLKSQGPSIVVDEIYRNESSMFEVQEWQHVFQRASALESDTDCRLWWKLFGTTCYLPGILKDLRVLLGGAPHQSGHSARSAAILERARRVHKALHNDHVIYQHVAPHPPSLFNLPVSIESPDRIRLRVFFLCTVMYICRVLATVSPRKIDRAACETDAQTFACQTLLMEEVAAKRDPAMAWHLRQRNGLAQSITQTREEWFSDKEHGMPRNKLKRFLAQRWLTWENAWRDRVLAQELGGDGV